MSELKFEDAMARLEKIVQELEKGELPLDKAIKMFEEGKKLAQICTGRLEAVMKKVEILRRREDGALEAEPFSLEVERRDKDNFSDRATGKENKEFNEEKNSSAGTEGKDSLF